MNTAQKQTGWGFAARWVAIITVTFLIGTAFAFASMWSFGGLILERLDARIAGPVSGVWVGALMGLGLGVGQAIALRGRGISPTRWVASSTLGGAAGFALFVALTAQGETQRTQLALLAGGMAGLGIGVAQWTQLRGRLSNAIIWVPVTVVAFLPVALLAYNGSEVNAGLVMLAMGLAVACITGLGAMWLFGKGSPAIAAQVSVLLLFGLSLAAYGSSSQSDIPLPPTISPDAHRIFHNGVVLTMNPDQPSAEAISLAGDRIEAVGSDADVLALRRPNSVVVDLQGRTLMPGFVDPHTHLFNDAEQYLDMTVAEAQQTALENGITTIGDMYVTEDFLGEMQEMERAGQLQIRTSLYLVMTDPCGESQGDWWQQYPPTRTPGERLRIGGVKIFTDGGVCKNPGLSYELEPGGGLGDLFQAQEELNGLVTDAQARGFQVVMHACGDRAIEQAQNAIAAALDGRPNSYRHRIDHNCVIRPEQLARYGEIGIVPLVFGPYALCEPFGPPPPPEYQAWEWPWRALLDANPGLPVAWHGDDPWFGRIRPLDDLYSLVTRNEVGEDGRVCEAPDWQKAHTVTVAEALSMMTINAAYALFRDEEVGSLESGKYADLIVVTGNPMAIEPEAIRELNVALTMIGGRAVYCADDSQNLCPTSETPTE